MTVTRYANNFYQGLAADTKPTNVPAGAIYRATDTGDIYHYDGAEWDLIIGASKTETLTNKTITAGSNTISGLTNTNIDASAAIDTTKLADSANFLLTTNTKTVTNKTIDLKDNTVLTYGVFLFHVFKNGSTYYLRNTSTGAIVTSNTSALTVLQAAVDNAHSNSGAAILVQAGTYLLSAKLNCIDKNFRMYGEGCLLSGNTGITNTDTVLKANYTGGAGTALIDCNNTVYNRQQFFDLVIDCSNTVPYGILAYDVRERYPWLQNVAVLDATDVGIRASKVVYTTCYNVVVASCTNIGLQLYDAGGGVMPNTMYWYGGRMTSNGINIQVDSSTDIGFNQIVLESGTTACVKTTANAAKQIRYRDCSFESHPAVTTDPMCDDSGVNITYDNCRYDSNNTTFHPLTIRAAARQVQILNGKFQANNGSTTAIITIESGAQDTVLIGNQQNTNTPMTITVNDSGTRTVRFGNSFDTTAKFTANIDAITLNHSTTNAAGDILKSNGTKFDRFARGTLYAQVPRVNSGQTDIEYARQAVFPSSNLYGVWGRKWGLYTGGGGTAAGLNLLNGLAVVTGGPAVAFGTIAYADRGRPYRWTQTGGVIGNKSGMKIGAVQTYRGWNPRLKCRFRLANNADSIFKFGFNSLGGDYTAGDDPFNAVHGIAFGKITTATNANWVMMSNDGTGATVITNVGAAFSAVAADNNIHTIEILADDANNRWRFSFDEGAYQDLTDAPTQQQVLGFCFQLEATNTTNPAFDIWWIEMESD